MKKRPEFRLWIGQDRVTRIVYATTAASTRERCQARIDEEGEFTDDVRPARFKVTPAKSGETFRPWRGNAS